VPRIRTIKLEMFQDEKLAPLDPIHRMVFTGLIAMADDAGRLLDNVKLIDGLLFPETDHSARESLAILSKAQRLLRYTASNGQRIIQIVNWAKHQFIAHPSKRVLPAPPDIAPSQPVVIVEVTQSNGGSPETLFIPHEVLLKDSGGQAETFIHDLGSGCRKEDIGKGEETTKALRRKALRRASRAVGGRGDALSVRNRISVYLETEREKELGKTGMRDLQIDVCFAYWAAKHGHDRAILDTKRVALIRRRLEENRGDLSELLFAIDGALRDKHLTENGYDMIQTILRDRGQVERLAALCPKYQRREMHAMAAKVLGEPTPQPVLQEVM